MNWAKFFKGLAHTALGGFAGGLAGYAAGPITLKTVLYPALGSALTSVFSYLSPSPKQQYQPRKL